MSLTFFASVIFLSSILHFSVQKIFIYYKRFDDFNHRSSHKALATRTGGIGIFLSVFIISLYYYFQDIEIFDYSLFIPLSIMFIVGVYDDLYNADFKLKFLLQVIVAKILIDQGYVITNYHGLFGLYEVPWLIAQLSTIFVFLTVVNAINFIDGIDGMAITEVLKVIFVIEFFSNDLTNIALLGFLVIASILPLYYFNFKKKKKVFLGDSGSLLLGTIISVYAFYFLGENYSFKEDFSLNKTLFIVLVLIYPLTDLLRVFLIRTKNKKSPFEPDQNHLHHVILRDKAHIYKLIFIQVLSLLFIYLVTVFI